MRMTVVRYCEVEADSLEEAETKANACVFTHEGPDSDLVDWECTYVKEAK